MSDATGAQVVNPQRLLTTGTTTGQAELVNRDLASLRSDANNRGAILLDFGREIHGGVRLVTGMWESKRPVRARIRFGESVSEAMSDAGGESGATNDHAIRDDSHLLPWLGTIEIGSTGFRFVRIDMAEPDAELLLREVSAAFVYRDVEYLGSFHSSDERLNRIWLTGAYTVHLNMQNYLWDGIKRDRLVWVGDLHPEVMTISSAFGHHDIVPRSLDLIRDATPLPEFMNGISSYSMWWVVIHREWYRLYGNLDYLRAQQNYLRGLLHLLISKTRNGREQIDGWRFLDWSTEGNEQAVDAGLQALMVIALESGAELSEALGDEKTADDARKVVAQARRHAAPKTDNKQATALLSLAGLVSARKANETLSQGGVRGYSTFYGYYILQAKAKAGDYVGAMNAIREYWGGMLDLGATSFWEDFDVAWLENAGRIDELPVEGKRDVHATYGEHSYKKLRMSLAHGWATGPTSWLTEHVLGVQVVEPGSKTLRIRPNLGDLSFVEGTFPTPLGLVKLRHTRQPDGSVKTDIEAPPGVRLIY
ncbi:MAG: alpha-L-rhamnosidase C-terminal domain-containing protein [Phycisphaerae bacterium]|nr:alpha-L-rhamnosidase C-terminal domain-containing protein [Phycisphaerae bacterium]